MYCASCGKLNPDGAKFCKYCGKPVATQPAAPEIPKPVQTAPVQATPAPVKEQISSKWPVAAGIFALLSFLLYLLGPVYLRLMTDVVFSGLDQTPALFALLLAVLLFAHTRRIPWITAIPWTLSLAWSVLTLTYIGDSTYEKAMILTPYFIMLILLLLYWVFSIKGRMPTGYVVVLLILDVLGAVMTVPSMLTLDLRIVPSYYLVYRGIQSAAAITTNIAYLIAAFALRKKPVPKPVPQGYTAPGNNAQPVRSGYAQPTPGAQPYAGQDPNDAPSGGYAVLGFFIPVVGLILYLVWKDQTPLRAKSAGKGALIGVIVGVVGSILLSILSVVLSVGILSAQY